MRTLWRLPAVLGLLAILVAFAAAWSRNTDDQLVVLAEFRPAEGSNWMGWRATVFDDRTLEVEFPEDSPQPSPRRLEARHLKRLLTKIEGADFEDLDASHDLTDGAGGDRLTLRVRTRDGYREISVDVPAHAVGLQEAVSAHDDRRDVETFLTIWAEVLRYVRTPNPDQTRKLYRL